MDSVNPYLPPKARLIDAEAVSNIQLATRAQRLGAALLDVIISLIWGIPINMALGIFDYQGRGQSPPEWLMVLSMVVGIAAFMLVNGYWLKQNGQTIGKRIVGIRIARLDDGIPSLVRLVVGRYLPVWIVSITPVLMFILPLIDVLFIFREDRRCIHDLIAGTKVVQVAPASVPRPAGPLREEAANVGPKGECPNCQAIIPLAAGKCPNCTAQFTADAVWKVKPL